MVAQIVGTCTYIKPSFGTSGTVKISMLCLWQSEYPIDNVGMYLVRRSAAATSHVRPWFNPGPERGGIGSRDPFCKPVMLAKEVVGVSRRRGPHGGPRPP